MGAPLATVAAFNAVLFSVRGQMEALLRSEPGVPLTVKQQVIAGAGAGVAVSFLACPTELIKCRLQAQSSLAEAAAASGVALPKGPIDVAKHVVRDAGARGLFKGLVPTMGREIPGNAVMFGVYEATKQYLAGGPDTSNLGRGSQILAGGLAGAALWLSVYPTDVVKSVIQVDDYKNPRYSGSLDALRKIVAADGVKGLYKGFGPAMARSVPANAATFVAYEITRSALDTEIGTQHPIETCKPCARQMGDVAKDLTAGTVGGAAQLVVGHPFDTIKVKLQSQPTPPPGQPPRYAGAADAVRQTLAAEGPRGLYKGMGAPLATVAAFNAVLFTVRGQMEGVLRSEPGAPLTVGQQVVAGAGAGVAVSFLACPTELIKCRLQAQSALATAAPAPTAAAAAGAGGVAAATVAAPAAAVKYGGPMDVARHVLRSEGGARGLFKGLFPTLAREVPGNALMFGVYEAIKQVIAGGQDTSQLGRGSLIVAGGLAGASFWGSVYPTDVVKSVLQVDDYKNPKYSGSMDAFRKILAADGVKGLYKGFGPAMARSVPANAACFLAYEVTRSALG
ncbi:Mitochondrial carnitine/acylcarnitine carrier-like protein [Dichanthelium oligosanthes]|uniref:Mitochondrial carnitine/acylcarnitine carrier-like protein n=1 Tax=Dichanthelium oligosanthes TaxID=888268 RepID=A0A1E5VNU5_9POAL|nr:Mitochondrial carnitine/acylcarnitine carrier-like protein [Dichanthelium oligosanthes]